MTAKNTLDDVVARNLRRLREAHEPRKWSRTELAAEFNKRAPPESREWNEWRVIDLEGGRTGKKPSPITWSELVTLCVVFDVLLWDLVLPDDDREVVLSGGSLSKDGWSAMNTHSVDAGELGEIVSGIPGKFVSSPEKMQEFKKTFNKENIAVAEVLDRQRDLLASVEDLVNQTTTVGLPDAPIDRSAEKDGSDGS